MSFDPAQEAVIAGASNTLEVVHLGSAPPERDDFFPSDDGEPDLAWPLELRIDRQLPARPSAAW